MKKKTINKLALGLAATSIVSVTSGCSKKDVSIPKTAYILEEDADNIYQDYTYYTGGTYVYKGQEYMEAHDPSDNYVTNDYNGISYKDGLNTSDLFFLRIDGKMFLATRVIDINEDNIVSKYYDIDTGEFLGQTLDINWYARATKDIDEILPPGSLTKTREHSVYVDNNLKDINYFNGEYGLGKNLCRESIISATSLFSNDKLSCEQIDELLDNKLLTSTLLESYNYPNMIPYTREDYTFIPLRYSDVFGITTQGYTVGFNGKTSTYLNEMIEFEVEDGDTTRKIIGYRGSTNKDDIGFNYIYDIESSRYIDITQYKVLSVKTALTYKSVDNIRRECDMYYPIDDLKVVSTKNLDGEDIFDKYYVAIRDEYAVGDTYKYKVLGEYDNVTLAGSYDGSTMCICKNGSIKLTTLGEYNGIMVPLKKCLEDNGLNDYIKDVYTDEEISMLLSKLREVELDLGTPINEVRDAYKKINMEDIIVIDTSIENGNDVLVDSDKRFYVLIPYEVSNANGDKNTKYYRICDDSGFASINLERKYILIDNVYKTFYAVLKTEGEINCIRTLDNVLSELGLDSSIRDQYALIDLQVLADKINKEGKVLVK